MRERSIVMSVPDLFFSVRITSTARQLGVNVIVCAPAELPEQCRGALPDLAILDLHTPGNLDAVRALRADAVTRELRVVGFYSHVDHAIRAAALESGVDDVMPRSAFTAKLAEILEGSLRG